MVGTRLETVRAGIQNCKTATDKAARLRSHSDPAVRDLADAIYFLSYGAQQIGLALSDESRADDLPIQRGQ